MANVPTVRRSRSLGGTWRYLVDRDGSLGHEEAEQRFAGHGEAKQIEVPHNWWFTELREYYGVVWYRREFDATELASDGDGSAWLRFEGIDYHVEVWLNGRYLGEHLGTFAPSTFLADQALDPAGRNVLLVRLDGPWDDTDVDRAPSPFDRYIEDEPYKRHWPREVSLVKGGLIDQMHKPGGFTSFWQDGNSAGIWGDVELVSAGQLVIDRARVICKDVKAAKQPEGMVAIDLTVDNRSGRTKQVEAVVTITGENFEMPVAALDKVRSLVVPEGRHTYKIVQTIEEPRFWWTWDHGFPHLYRIDVGVREGDRWHDAVSEVSGFKELHIDTDTKQFFLNGQRVFIRGMRYSSSSWRVESLERYERDVPAIKEANQNAIRIGSHVERKEFYETCDRLGLLVWQVGPFHYCVTDSDEMVETGSEQVGQMVDWLHNHVSIGLWSTFKEPEVYGNPVGEKPNNYNRLCEIAAETARAADPNRWVHKGDYRDNVQNVTVGEILPWDTDLRRLVVQPIVIEYGAASLPALETIREFLPEEDIWPPNWDGWARNGFWPGYLERWGIPVPDTIEEFIELSQAYHAMNTKEIVEHFRRNKYGPISSFWYYFWSEQFPGFGSGIVDYFGRPYAALEQMREACVPVLASVEWLKSEHIVGKRKHWRPGSRFGANIWATNDLLEDLPDCTVETRLARQGAPDEPEVVRSQAGLHLPADSSTIGDAVGLTLPSNVADYRIDVVLRDVDGEVIDDNWFEFSVY
jgi:beta-mannosidase